jgi:uncharacterized protein (DUF4415 family)
MRSKLNAKNIVVDVTEAEYRVDLARGLKEDEVLKPGRHTFRRGGFLARHGHKLKQATPPAKVRISINLDLDILNYFKQRAAHPNAAPYQTQINNTLREVMERDQTDDSSRLSSHATVLLSDPRFIEAVAKRIKAQNVPQQKRKRHAA